MTKTMSTPQQLPAPGDQPDQRRRGFLKAVPLGAIAAAVAGRATAAEAAPAAAAPAVPQPSGYHETEHIQRYYRTAAYW